MKCKIHENCIQRLCIMSSWCGNKAPWIYRVLHSRGLLSTSFQLDIFSKQESFLFFALMASLPLSRKSEGPGRSMKNPYNLRKQAFPKVIGFYNPSASFIFFLQEIGMPFLSSIPSGIIAYRKTTSVVVLAQVSRPDFLRLHSSSPELSTLRAG